MIALKNPKFNKTVKIVFIFVFDSPDSNIIV